MTRTLEREVLALLEQLNQWQCAICARQTYEEHAPDCKFWQVLKTLRELLADEGNS